MNRFTRLTRRAFLGRAAAAGAAAAAGGCAVTVLPARSARTYAANQKLNLAVLGGGIGVHNTEELAKLGENIVAVCDVDRHILDSRWQKWPQARRYQDFRRMFEKEKLDGIVVATPDHSHAAISLMAMRLGLHVFCQKPLTWSVHEARLMAKVAKETGAITQMGTDSAMGLGPTREKALLTSGLLGDVVEVHAWTDRPIWLQGATRPAGEDPVPPHLDWDLWLGPAPARPFKAEWPADHPARKMATWKHAQVYHPFVWRGWSDFGTGACGDIAPHTLDTVYWNLDLDAPASVDLVEASGPVGEMFPESTVLKYNFPARGKRAPVSIYWYDGGKRPPETIAPGGSDHVVYIGTKGSHPMGRGPFFGEKREPYHLPEGDYHGRDPIHQDWTDGIRLNRQPSAHFGYSGPFTESYLLGNIALKVGRRIEWDTRRLRVTNCREANAYLTREYRKGWDPGR